MSTAVHLATRSGISLSARPATPDDEAALKAFFNAVSDEDRRFRFLSASKRVSTEQLAPLLRTDNPGTASFLAFDEATDELVASGLLACSDDLEFAEVAISVRHDYRGRGVGWAMLDLLAEEARRRGVKRVMSIESRENHAAIELEREKGFVPEAFEGDPTLVMLSKTFG